ncbi:hypothetical protein MKAN_15330 [Mycobacterium kansasii ATCC 12478]|uniref:Uncharacterized protein n=1 Tax=Mycobacterium kansasii ATCC 12478 TaxID=557599 RepID=U5WYF4_MYCKA|nr:hypothetical protein MKAN_15330 [Mycobacterium kansasii ATCC 12478]
MLQTELTCEHAPQSHVLGAIEAQEDAAFDVFLVRID